MPQVSLANNIIGGTSISDSRIANLSDSINLFVETQGQGASAQAMLRSIYGSVKALQLPEGECKGLFVCQRNWQDRQSVYAVYGNTLYVIWRDEFGSMRFLSLVDVSPTCRHISIVENGAETPEESYIFAADGQNVWAIPRRKEPYVQQAEMFSLNIPYKVNSTTDRIKPSKLAYCYGYLVCNDDGSDAFYTSYQYPMERKKNSEIDRDVFQLEKYGDTGFITYAEWSTDTISNLISNGTYLYTFGADSTQVFTYNRDVDAPFVSPTNSANGIGLKAVESLAVNADNIFWLGGSRVGENGVFNMVGANIVKVSSSDIDRLVMNMEHPQDAIGQCWVECGHLFYALTFVTDDVTLVYDASEKVWHKRSSTDLKTTLQHRWRQKWAVLYEDKVFFGVDDGAFIYMDSKAYVDYIGRPIVKTRRCGGIIDGFKHFIVDSVELVCNCGELTDVNLTPKMQIRYCDDGGDWSNGMLAYLGKVGEYKNRVEWWNLGCFRVMGLEISCSEPIQLMIVAAKLKWSALDW